MSETRRGGTWGEATLAGLPHVLFPLIAEISLIARYLKPVPINEDAAMLAFAGVIVVMLIFAWRRRWPRWVASWIGYGLIVAWIAPFGLDGGYTVPGWLSSQMPTALADLFFFAQILFSFGVGFLLAGLAVILHLVPVQVVEHGAFDGASWDQVVTEVRRLLLTRQLIYSHGYVVGGRARVSSGIRLLHPVVA